MDQMLQPTPLQSDAFSTVKKDKTRRAMRKPRYSEMEILQILNRSKGWSVEEITEKFGVSRATLYRWRARYLSRMSASSGLDGDIHARLARLEEQTGKLRALCNSLLHHNTVKML